MRASVIHPRGHRVLEIMGSHIAIRVPSEATDGAVQELEVAIELDGHVARVPAGSVVE